MQLETTGSTWASRIMLQLPPELEGDAKIREGIEKIQKLDALLAKKTNVVFFSSFFFFSASQSFVFFLSIHTGSEKAPKGNCRKESFQTAKGGRCCCVR
jgi:hypothetical protein